MKVKPKKLFQKQPCLRGTVLNLCCKTVRNTDCSILSPKFVSLYIHVFFLSLSLLKSANCTLSSIRWCSYKHKTQVDKQLRYAFPSTWPVALCNSGTVLLTSSQHVCLQHKTAVYTKRFTLFHTPSWTLLCDCNDNLLHVVTSLVTASAQPQLQQPFSFRQ